MKRMEMLFAVAIGSAFIASEAKTQEPQGEEPQGEQAETSTTAGHSMMEPRDFVWKAGPEGLPPGAQVAVLEGDPTQAGPFTVRVKVPAGYRVMPHWHPADEHLTVLEGSISMGLGDQFQEKSMREMGPSSFVVLAARTHHYVMTKNGATFQLHGMGPWGINYLNPADDPRQQALLE